MEAALKATGIEFGWGKAPLLEGVSIEVMPGEIVGVIGPNGSGKTTLLNILCWGIVPNRGEVLLMGKPAREYQARERARVVAMVPQEPRVAFPFTVAEIVLMGRAPYLGRWELEGRDDAEIAAEAMEVTGLTELRGRRFHELSGGERQRVMIAKALAQKTGVLLLDEPTAFLDLKHQVGIYSLVRELAEKGMAVAAVSHDVNLAAAFCDRLAVLSKGTIVASGRPAEVLDKDVLERVYGVRVGLASHPERPGAPLVFPLGGGSP